MHHNHQRGLLSRLLTYEGVSPLTKTMEGLAEYLRSQSFTTADPVVRWASEVEAAQAALSSPAGAVAQTQNARDLLASLNKPPKLRCTFCGRKSWDESERGVHCDMPQPNGKQCVGTMIAAYPAVKEVEAGGWPLGLLDRIKAAEQRVQDNRAPRSIPADPHSDVDLVLAEVRYLIEGRWPPFWIKGDAPDAAGASPSLEVIDRITAAGGVKPAERAEQQDSTSPKAAQ